MKGDNGRRLGQLREGPQKRKKHIRALEAVLLNQCEGVRRGGRDQLATLRRMIVLH